MQLLFVGSVPSVDMLVRKNGRDGGSFLGHWPHGELADDEDLIFMSDSSWQNELKVEY